MQRADDAILPCPQPFQYAPLNDRMVCLETYGTRTHRQHAVRLELRLALASICCLESLSDRATADRRPVRHGPGRDRLPPPTCATRCMKNAGCAEILTPAPNSIHRAIRVVRDRELIDVPLGISPSSCVGCLTQERKMLRRCRSATPDETAVVSNDPPGLVGETTTVNMILPSLHKGRIAPHVTFKSLGTGSRLDGAVPDIDNISPST